jgi:SUMO ligase MMS21 Smc5/6 complex component
LLLILKLTTHYFVLYMSLPNNPATHYSVLYISLPNNSAVSFLLCASTWRNSFHFISHNHLLLILKLTTHYYVLYMSWPNNPATHYSVLYMSLPNNSAVSFLLCASTWRNSFHFISHNHLLLILKLTTHYYVLYMSLPNNPATHYSVLYISLPNNSVVSFLLCASTWRTW